MSKRSLWIISSILSFLLFLLYCISLYFVSIHYTPAATQLTSSQDVSKFLQKSLEKKKRPGLETPVYIPTGLFIESIKFNDPNTVNVTGYVWQKFTKNFPMNIKRGIVFPEGSDIKKNQVYDRMQDGIQTIGWYFESDFVQGFDYSRYPLDNKVVTIRLWAEDFDKNIILTPDLDAYDSTQPHDKFGLDPDFKLQGYSFLETYFKYVPTSYDTNFGIKNYIGQKNFPELFFNIVLQRNVTNAIITNLIPLLVVLVILLGSLTTITSKKDEQEKYGFSLSAILGLCSFMLFVVLTAHIRLREFVADGGIIYLEYIFFIMYFATIYISLTAFLILKAHRNKFISFLAYKEGLILKVLFLPLIFFLIDLVTYVCLIAL